MVEFMKLNLKTHKQGGYTAERFHLNKEQWVAARISADRYGAGLCAAEQYNRLTRTDIPYGSTAPGIRGQWAFNDQVYFECIDTDTWCAVPLYDW